MQQILHASSAADEQFFHFVSGQKVACPYLPGLTAQELVTRAPMTQKCSDRFIQAGYRRFGQLMYRPVCHACNACQSLRVDVSNFCWKRRWRKILARNADLVRGDCGVGFHDEHQHLFADYVMRRHGYSGSVRLLSGRIRELLSSPSDYVTLFEWRSPDRRLRCAMIAEELDSGWSAIYAFRDLGQAHRSLGSFMILDLIIRSFDQNLPYCYLGYHIAGAPRSDYKCRFQPFELFKNGCWQKTDASSI
ncbi:MAG: hypothetical protein AAF418_06655 [Pseudomonadota bacterium]